MGARVYIASMGRFLQVDPVDGGTDNNYAYVNDPVNDFDLDGNVAWGKLASGALAAATFVPGPIGMIASGISAARYAMKGNWGAAAVAAAGFIPGGRIASSLALKSARGTRILKSVMNAQARSRGIGAKSRLFGVRSKLNNGRWRIGWSQGTKGRLNFRIGRSGSHKALFGYKFNTGYKFHNVLKGVYR